METLRKQTIFFRRMIVILSTIFILSTIISPIKSHADIVNYPNTDFLYVNSPIVLEFDNEIQFNPDPAFNTIAPNAYDAAHPGISLEEDSGYKVEISMKIDPSNPRRLIITPNPTQTIAPFVFAWKKNKDYTLKISDHIVLDSSLNIILPLPATVTATTPAIEYPIRTYFLTFEELMSGSNPEINRIIQDYTPRKINVTAPVRYVDELAIIHKRRAIVQNNTTESVTNIDITVNDRAIDNQKGDIKRIIVTPKMNGVPLQTAKVKDNLNVVSNAGRKLYDFGFTQLPDTSAFDIEVILDDDDYDYNKPLDVRIVKVPYETNNTTTIKKIDRYRFAGKTFTLFDLINRPRDLQSLLDENRMDEIKVQVVQQ